jgi:ferredoxin-type protein NapG
VNLSGSKQFIRPPGAIPEDSFFKKCIKCGLCVEVCPTRALDFIGLTRDIKKIGTPKINIKYGGCIAWKSPCMRCIESCPTHALLRPRDIRRLRLGSAFVREKECINCLMCFQECPIDGAVLFPNPNGDPFKEIKDIPTKLCDKNSPLKPSIDNSLCTGCGLCAHICPTRCIELTPENEIRMAG